MSKAALGKLFTALVITDIMFLSLEFIYKNTDFSYLLTSKWQCAKTGQVASGHAYNE